ncbi:MAG TPA: terminase TerL endonuclease subunit [Xanthobacteraceae bacterium]|nr:terminase TerL endonuclease subunit [Xanthobacteraceae bacterium]
MRAMLFASTMPNIKGPEAGKPIRLMDWQKLVFANIFGFVERETGTRRFQRGSVFVPRGNGKTTVSAPLALYMTFGEGEGGAEGYAAAVTRDQARILFDTATHMVRRSPEIRNEWGVGVLTHSIFQAGTASRFVPISSDAKSLDGLSVQCAVCDEIGSHRTSEVYDALLTGLAKRRQSFLLSISTATGNTAGIGKQLWDYGLRLLQQSQEDDRFFSLIYSIDDDDDPWAEETWIKANPGWGQSVQPDAIRAIMRQARNNPAQEAAARTRHLNVWVGADEALFSLRSWQACTDRMLRLDDFLGRPCHLALDLASRTDLAALAIVFPEPDDGYAVFARCYLNEAAVLEARHASYPGWAADGDLIVTPGEETDFQTIEDDIVDLCKRFRVESVAYDPWGSTQLAQRLGAQGVPVVEFRSTTPNFSEPTKELDAAMRAGRLRHDGNGPLTWCVSNVVGHYDARSNVFPRKARPENKIDGAVALIMAIARVMTSPGPSVYEGRGLLTLQ